MTPSEASSSIPVPQPGLSRPDEATKVIPDLAELTQPDFDNVVPTRGYQMLPLVGLGGSAGSLPALQGFFGAMPPDSGMAFAVVLHLSPMHESAQAELLRKATDMPVIVASDGIRVEANQVYVIPPGKHLISADGHLRLTDLDRPRGKRVAVDLFFRTLADTHGPHAAAIILSGGDADGAIGIKRIKERGGLTIAQDPAEAETSGMPRSAIATGMVDWVLPVAEMPARLIEYRRMEPRLKLPPEEGPQPARAPAESSGDGEAALHEIIALLRARTGRDFSYYKRATIMRRIARRMQVNSVADLPAYLAFLRMNPGEAGALFEDLLISVTNFFRDRESFEALKLRLPEIFKGKGANDAVRIWVAACATGEEAYSLAMLLSEYMRDLESAPVIQIFATDLHDGVIAAAREAIYPDTIVADVSEERLRRFFIKEERGYRVRREIRELVLFAQHDLLKDSPFSRLDLVSCRNLLIYLTHEAQKRALEIFHFALRPNGLLFLGSSETVEDGSSMYAVADKHHRVYTARARMAYSGPLPAGAAPPSFRREAQDRPRGGPSLPGPGFDKVPLGREQPAGGRTERGISWSELHLKLIEQLAPPSVVVNSHHEIVHVSENATRFLEFPSGAPTTDLLNIVHPMLRIELRAVLYRAAQLALPAESLRVPVDLKGVPHLVDIRVSPVAENSPDFFLVVFEATPMGGSSVEPKIVRAEPDLVAEHLETELERMKAHLRETVEQHEASIEELRASNEELQAMNEELRSATEELEISREELQSINEELTTVNQELKSKVDELGHTNSDLHNLMASTAIATVFLDRDLRVTRYTPSAVALFNLIPTDVGRPLTDLKDRLDYPELARDARRVLEHLVPIECEVSGAGQKWFLARLLPYRTTEDRIAGVVLTFVDITERTQAEDALRSAQEQLEQRVEQRTSELAEANRALSREIDQRARAEKARQDMMQQLDAVQEEERSRISRGLHDEVGQLVTALMLDLKSLSASGDVAGAREKLQRMQELVEQIGRSTHKLAVELRPTSLDDLGLVQTLKNYLEEWSGRTQIEVDFHATGFETRLSGAIETTLFRIICEALNNVVKHARATQVNVLLEQRGDLATAIVEDDGVGFEESERPRHPGQLGLETMRERAALLDGEVTVESRPEREGTSVFVRLPLNPHKDKSHSH